MKNYDRNLLAIWLNIVVGFLIISTITSLIISYFILDKVYTSSAILMVEGDSSVERATKVYSSVAKSDNTFKQVAARIDSDLSPGHLSKKIDITSREDMGLIYITGNDNYAEDSKLIVETIIEVIMEESMDMFPNNRLVVIGGPELPLEPSRPKPLFNLVVAWALSIVLSVVIMLFNEKYGTAIYDMGDLSGKVDIMGIIPHVTGRFNSIALIKSNAVEAFKVLRINIEAHWEKRGVILVTSSGIGEGKTTVASSLAISMAKAGSKVILIECDMRRPVIRDIFDIESSLGLADVFWRDTSLDDVINGTNIANLDVITSGYMADSPVELFSSTDIMRKFFVVMRSRYDTVIIDTPCALSLADTLLLSKFADNILMVIKYGKTRHEMFIKACGELERVGAKVSGVVLNCVPISKIPYMKFYI